MSLPEDWRTLYRNAFDTVQGIDWDEIIRQEGGMPPAKPYDQDDEEECEEVELPEGFTAHELQAAIDSAIHIGIGITPDSVEPLLEAWDHWIDHECESHRPLLDSVLELLIAILIEKGSTK